MNRGPIEITNLNAFQKYREGKLTIKNFIDASGNNFEKIINHIPRKIPRKQLPNPMYTHVSRGNSFEQHNLLHYKSEFICTEDFQGVLIPKIHTELDSNNYDNVLHILKRCIFSRYSDMFIRTRRGSGRDVRHPTLQEEINHINDYINHGTLLDRESYNILKSTITHYSVIYSFIKLYLIINHFKKQSTIGNRIRIRYELRNTHLSRGIIQNNNIDTIAEFLKSVYDIFYSKHIFTVDYINDDGSLICYINTNNNLFSNVNQISHIDNNTTVLSLNNGNVPAYYFLIDPIIYSNLDLSQFYKRYILNGYIFNNHVREQNTRPYNMILNNQYHERRKFIGVNTSLVSNKISMESNNFPTKQHNIDKVDFVSHCLNIIVEDNIANKGILIYLLYRYPHSVFSHIVKNIKHNNQMFLSYHKDIFNIPFINSITTDVTNHFQIEHDIFNPIDYITYNFINTNIFINYTTSTPMELEGGNKKSKPTKLVSKKSTPKKSTPKKSTPKKSTPKKSVSKKSVSKKSVSKKSTPTNSISKK